MSAKEAPQSSGQAPCFAERHGRILKIEPDHAEVQSQNRGEETDTRPEQIPGASSHIQRKPKTAMLPKAFEIDADDADDFLSGRTRRAYK